jgi:hypothetical protein
MIDDDSEHELWLVIQQYKRTRPIKKDFPQSCPSLIGLARLMRSVALVDPAISIGFCHPEHSL